MSVCLTCGLSEFGIDSGLYFCRQCGTQLETLQKEIEDVEHQVTSNVSEIKSSRKRQLREVKSDTSNRTWLTYEAFNIILCHQVQALIRLGASPQLKEVTLQLWATYLQRCEICFKESVTGDQWMPSLGITPRKRDVQILCGAKDRKKSKKKNHTSKRVKKEFDTEMNETVVDKSLESKQNLEDTAASPTASICTDLQYPKRTPSSCRRSSFSKREIKRQGLISKLIVSDVKKRLPDYMVLSKTLSFCYLGVLLTEDSLLLGDIIRFAKDGHFPYMDAVNFLPPEMILSYSDYQMVMPGVPPTMSNSITSSTSLGKFLKLPKLKHPPLLPIAARFIKDFKFPLNLISHVQTVISELHYEEYWCPCDVVNKRNIGILHYEVKAMASVLVTLKLLFCLNDKSERQHSKLISKINTISPELKLFVWDEWFSSTKLKAEFLRIRNVSYSRIHQITDAESLAVFYQTTAQNWSSKLKHGKKLKSFNPEFRSSLRSILSNVTLRKNFSMAAQPLTCFPISGKLHHEIDVAKSSRQYLESSFEWSILTQDFSDRSVQYSYRHHKKKLSSNKKALKLLTKLNDKFYSMKSEVPSHSSINLQGSYWYLKCTRQDSRVVYESAPQVFKWLVDFSSEFIECNNYELFYEVWILEKTIFKFK